GISTNRIDRSFHAVIRQSDSQGTISVAQTGRYSLPVQIVVVDRHATNGDFTIPTLRTISVEGVTNTKLEAREVRGLVHDHVIETGAGSRRERSTHVGLAGGQAVLVDCIHVLGGDVGLTTEVELTPGIASQTERQVTTEQTVALPVVTGTKIETAFRLEHSAEAVTQVFGTLQAPAVARLDTLDHASALCVTRISVRAEL